MRSSSSEKAELQADLFGLLKIFFSRWPAFAHQEVEGEGLGHDVVFVKLRGHADATPPFALAERVSIQAVRQ
jgi:hypothetical protein